MKKLSIVVPCYNEQETVEKFYETAISVLEQKANMELELIFVNDGSRDETLPRLTALAKKDSRVKVINFSRNFGQQAAILCGFRHATGDCAVELDCDLQDPLEVVLLMLEKWREGFDIVHGRRKARRGESFFKKFTAKVYYKFLAKICNYEMPRNTGDFKLLDRKVLDVICSMNEHDKYLRGLESWVGFKQTFVDFDRAERYAGGTHYSLKKMIALAKSGIVSNSNYPLTLGFKFGAVISLLSIIGFVVLIVLAATHTYTNLVAWLFPTIGLLFGSKMTIDALTNLYIGKIYDEVKNRPEYIVSDKINID